MRKLTEPKMVELAKRLLPEEWIIRSNHFPLGKYMLELEVSGTRYNTQLVDKAKRSFLVITGYKLDLKFRRSYEDKDDQQLV